VEWWSGFLFVVVVVEKAPSEAADLQCSGSTFLSRKTFHIVLVGPPLNAIPENF
jgi:hypothetical protein